MLLLKLALPMAIGIVSWVKTQNKTYEDLVEMCKESQICTDEEEIVSRYHPEYEKYYKLTGDERENVCAFCALNLAANEVKQTEQNEKKWEKALNRASDKFLHDLSPDLRKKIVKKVIEIKKKPVKLFRFLGASEAAVNLSSSANDEPDHVSSVESSILRAAREQLAN